MTYSKSTFFLFLTFFISFNIIADERAPSSQCYINGGWALEANIGKKSTNPSYKMEIEYERNEAGNSWLVVSYKDF